MDNIMFRVPLVVVAFRHIFPRNQSFVLANVTYIFGDVGQTLVIVLAS